MRTALNSRRAGAVIAVLGAFLTMTLAAVPASAQDGPYGSTSSTTTPQGPDPSCQLRTGAGTPGSSATVTVRAVPRGSTVRMLFDGRRVAEAEATGPGASPRVNIDIDFTVPPAEPGMYTVTAVGTDFSVSCQTGNGSDFEVLATQSRGGENGGGSLARTGIYVALLLAVAAALLLLGRTVLEAARRRQRQAQREARAAAGHLAGSDRTERMTPN